MNAGLKPEVSTGSFTRQQGICAMLLGLGFSMPAHAASDAVVSVAGWSIALVVVLGVAYLLSRKKE